VALSLEGYSDWSGAFGYLGRLTMPVLFGLGEKEDANRRAEEACNRPAPCRVARIAGAGHVGTFPASQNVGPIIRRFLQTVSETSAW
jgi:hypothetical protein